jgi:hypothetical protein
MACLRAKSKKSQRDIPVVVRETKHEMRDKVARVEGELGGKVGDEFSVVFADWRLQHHTSIFTAVKVDGKEWVLSSPCRSAFAWKGGELTLLLVDRAGSVKMDRDSRPLNCEPNYDREWQVSAYKDETVRLLPLPLAVLGWPRCALQPFTFGPNAQGQVVIELHSVRAETGEAWALSLSLHSPSPR